MPTPAVDTIYPSDRATGVIIGTPIIVIFDDEIDVTTLPGGFMIEGPDTDRWTGPDMALYDLPDTDETENILDSPNFKGIVQGTFSYELLDQDGVSVSALDYSGLGSGDTSYKHKITFTPTHILSPLTAYTVYLSGDEDLTDSINTGISTRTVFSPQAGTNIGDGMLVASGGYTDTVDDVFRFTITSTGNFGIAEYSWYRDSASHIVRTGTVSKLSLVLLGGDDLEISWTGLDSAPFVIGDTFTLQVRTPVYMESSYSWTFTTGSGSITSLPTSASTSPIGISGSISEPLQIISIVPDTRDTNVSTGTRVIKITFNKPVDEDTVTDKSIIINALPVNGDSSIAASGYISKIIRVESNVVYLIMQSGDNPE